LLKAYFFEELPPGWYEFEISVQYSYEGNQYLSENKKIFDLVIPETAHVWYLPYSEYERELIPSFVELDFSELDARTAIQTHPVPNQNASLVFRSEAGLDNAYYIWDLGTGIIDHVGNINLISSITDAYNSSLKVIESPPALDPSGWYRAIELFIPGWSVDIGIVDIKQGTLTYISRTNTLQEFHPAWSPSGNQLAYVVYAPEDNDELNAGQADIYVYDVGERISSRVSFTPDIIEAQPTWIDENAIAFLMPDTSLGGFFSSDRVPTNSRIGLGVLDLLSGNVDIIIDTNVNEFDNLEYYQVLEKLVVDFSLDADTIDLFTLDGRSIGVVTKRGHLCRLLDTPTLQQLCWNRGSIGIFNEQTEEFVELVSRGQDEEHAKILGSAMPEGFIIADLENNIVLQYSEDGNFIQEWSVPNMRDVFEWGVDELTLIVGD
jgi:hypothetical protein